MNKLILSFSLILAFIFTGCANNNTITYDAQNHNKINQVLVGKIIHIRNVAVKDDGAGTLIGGVIGGVLGSTIGSGNGSTLASLGGAIAGGVVGNEVGKENAQELTVQLENGETIVVLSKGTNLQNQDRVRIVKSGDTVSSVYKF